MLKIDKKEIKELIIKHISSFSLIRLVNILNHNLGICHSCKYYVWLEPQYKHDFLGCEISHLKFDEHFNCFGKKFEPNKYLLKDLNK